MGAVLAYDITNYKSFISLKEWLKEVREHAGNKISIIMVGNKSDLAHSRAVSVKEAAKFAKLNRVSFIETSALDARNVSEAFDNILAGKRT